MEKLNEIQGPLHLLHCMGQLATMYVSEIKSNILTALEDSLDCWGDE